MQIIIDIPENTYRRIQALARDGYFEHDICGNSMRRIANGTPLPTLTDTEQRLFLSAISREEKVCKSIDEDKVLGGDVKMLVPLCRNIKRKVKEVLF